MVRVRVVLEKKLMSVVVTNVSTTAVEVVSRASGEVISESLMTLKMTSAKVVITSVTTISTSPSQDYCHSCDLTSPSAVVVFVV